MPLASAPAKTPAAGNPVAFVSVPDEGVPRAGVVRVGEVRVRPAIVVVVDPLPILVDPIVIGNPLPLLVPHAPDDDTKALPLLIPRHATCVPVRVPVKTG
jgi:hypothetical protein